MSTLILKEYALDSKPGVANHAPHASPFTITAFPGEKQIFFGHRCPNPLWVLAINLGFPSPLINVIVQGIGFAP